MNRWTGYLSILLLALVTTAASRTDVWAVLLWLVASLLGVLLVVVAIGAVLSARDRRRVR